MAEIGSATQTQQDGTAMTIDPNNLSGTAKLTFADEFNTLNLWDGKSGTWTTGDSWGNEKGFTLAGNGEQEWYINSTYAPTQNIKPWSVSDGVLNLTAQPTDDATKAIIGDHPYTSGQINTFNSFSQQYGYFEMRAQLPEGKGMWPAFWLLPENNSWPPEIDVIENLGDNMNKYYTTVHTNETGSHTMSTTNITTPDLSAGYHNYGVDWEADKTTFFLDGKQVFQTDTPADMHNPMYMVANLAVGGYWPGYPDGSTAFPATMKIDYIRAYSDGPNAQVVAPTHTAAIPTTSPSTNDTPAIGDAQVTPTTVPTDSTNTDSTPPVQVTPPVPALPASPDVPSTSTQSVAAPPQPTTPAIDQKIDFSGIKDGIYHASDKGETMANWHAQHEFVKPDVPAMANIHISDVAFDHLPHLEMPAHHQDHFFA